MSIPSLSTLQKIAVESYNPSAKQVDDWMLVDETPTLKFYMKGMDTVVGIRGTFNAEDTSADAMISAGRLESSKRFKTDLKVMTDYANSHKGTNIYGVGHSLGGAILDLFLKKGLIKEGVSYNPAVQPQDLRSILPNRRIYMSGDPLYAIFGNLLRQTPEVRKSKTSLFGRLAKFSPIASAPEYLKSHGLAQFEGGVHPEVQGIMTEIADIKPTFPKQRIARLKQKVIEGSDKLAHSSGFKVTRNEKHGTYNITVSESPKHPKVKIIRYSEDNAIGHEIILRNNGPYSEEFYNPNGEALHKLPKPVQDFIKTYGSIDVRVSKEHQGVGPICTRASIKRACYSDLTNKQYDEMLIREASKANIPVDDYIWKWTKDELGKIGASKRGGLKGIKETVKQYKKELPLLHEEVNDLLAKYNIQQQQLIMNGPFSPNNAAIFEKMDALEEEIESARERLDEMEYYIYDNPSTSKYVNAPDSESEEELIAAGKPRKCKKCGLLRL